MPKILSRSELPDEPLGTLAPLLPTIVIASYKGGVWKTSVAVAIAERLALAGCRVLLLTCDTQEDARARLGVRPTDPMAACKAYGSGSVTVVGLRGQRAVDILYRHGPQAFGLHTPFDLVIVDTPPEVQGASLPGAWLIATTDGMDATRNLVKALRKTPPNTDIILVRAGWDAPDQWAQNVGELEQALGRPLNYIGEPLPWEQAIHDAHDEGRSVWNLPRRGRTLKFLTGIETLARGAWDRYLPNRQWPAPPPASAAGPYVPGWDRE